MKRVCKSYLRDENQNIRRMTLTIFTTTKVTRSRDIGYRKSKHKKGDISSIGIARRQIRDACRILEETGNLIFYSTFTYSTLESRARVALLDLERLCQEVDLVGGKFLGVMELTENGGLHLHCLSSIQLEAKWGKGFVHEKERYYNAEKAGSYLSKQYGNKVKYQVKYRGGVKIVEGMEGFRKLWTNMPYLIVDAVTKAQLGVYDYKERSKKGVREVTTLDKNEIQEGKGELFTVIRADLECVERETLERMGLQEFKQRLNSIHVSRGVNGTLYAHNNAKEPSPLMRWMIQNKKQVLIDTFWKARESLLVETVK